MDNKDDQAEGDSDLWYHISPLKNQPVDIFDTIWNNRGDPAYHVCCLTDSNYCDCWLINTWPLKKFLLKLQDHLLGWLMGCEFDGDMHKEFTDSDQNSIHFIGTKIYSVQTCHIYYTSYDLGMWHSQPPDTPRHYAAISHYQGRCWTLLVCEGSWHLSCQYLVQEFSNSWWQKHQAYGFPLGLLVWQRTRLSLRISPSVPA